MGLSGTIGAIPPRHRPTIRPAASRLLRCKAGRGRWAAPDVNLGSVMVEPVDRRTNRRLARARRSPVRTVPSVLRLAGPGGEPGANGEMTAAELIALARAARLDAAGRAEPG